MRASGERCNRCGRGPSALSDRVGRVRFYQYECEDRCEVNQYGKIDRVNDRLNW